MAESSVVIGDDNEKNFILAKLVSLFGDTVDFDVINLVAQENEWNEKKCIELLEVLGEYKNADATPLTSDVLENLASDNQSEATSKTESERARQLKKTDYLAAAATSKSAKPKMAGINPGNTQLGLARARHLSPSNAVVQRSAETQEHHDKVKGLIQSGTPVLILLRGLPGSGKTTLAKSLLSLPGAKGGCSHSTDNFFLVPRGGKGSTEYHYDPLRLGEAHEWNRVQVLRAIAHGVTPIIVDNTNVQKWEMMPYVEMALEPWKAEKTLRTMAANGSIPKNNICSSLGPARLTMKGKKCSCGYTVAETYKVPYQIELLEPLTWWYRNPSRLAKVNQHGVSQKKITQMLSNFEFDVTGKSLGHIILKKKSNSFVTPPGVNVRPSIQAGKPHPPLNLSGAPLYNMMPKKYQGNQFGARPRPMIHPNIPGNNAFRPNSGIQFPSPARFSAVGHPQLQFPRNFLSTENQAPIPSLDPLSNRNQYNAAKINQTDMWTPKEQPRKDDSNLYPLNRQSAFSKSTSNISFIPEDIGGGRASSMEPKERNEGLRSSSLATSESNICEKATNSETSFIGSECVEMSEEELKEWMKNDSKWEWESSDEDSEDECRSETNEPKPARSLKPRLKDNTSEITAQKESKIGETSTASTKSADGMAVDEEIPEWVTEKFDPLTSWNPPEFTLENAKDTDVEAPLPPRNSKRKRLAGDPPEPDDSSEQPEKPSSNVDQMQLGIIQQIHSLLGELGVGNKELDSPNQACDSSADEVEGDNKNLIPESEVPVESSANYQLFDSCINSAILKSEDVVSSVKIDTLLVGGANEEPSVTLPDPSKSDISAVESESSLIPETGTKSSESSDNISNDVSENDNAMLGEKIDEPLLAAFNVILSTNPVDDKMVVNSLSTENIVSKEELKETRNESLEVDSFSFRDEQNIESQNNLKFIASIISEGFKWFDAGFQRRSKDGVKETKEAEKEFKAKFSQSPTSEITVFDNVNQPVPLADNFQGTEDLECKSDKLLSLKLQDKDVKLMEDTEISEKSQDSEKEERNANVSLIETMERFEDIWHPSVAVEISYPMQQDKEKEISAQLQAEDSDCSKVSVCLQNYVKGSENEEEKDIQFLDTPASDASLVSEIKLPTELFDLRNTQIIKTNDVSTDVNTSDIAIPLSKTCSEEGNVDKNLSEIICDSNAVQSSISSSSIGTSSFTFLDNDNASVVEEMSELHSQSVKEKEQGVSLLDILEKLRKDRENAVIEPPSVPELQTVEEIKEKEVVDSKGNSPPLWTEKDQGFSDILAVSGLRIDEEKRHVSVDRATKGQMEKEEFLSDWSALDAEEGDAVDFDDDNETFPLVLDPSFIEQICQKFGNPYQDSMDESSKFSVGNNQSGVTVQVPAYLARKLHECWLKTQWDAILDEEETSQKIVLEDELLARQLQELEKEDLKEKRDHNASSSSTTPNLREIMDMEMAMAIYKAEQDRKTSSNQKSDLSSRLSWDMLTKEFPQIPQDVITEIFSAYNFSYSSARDALLSSLPDYERDLHEGSVKDVVSPEVLAAQEKALIEKAKLESLKSEELSEEDEKIEKEVEGSWEAQVDQARKSAALNRRLQKERHAQAQAASRSGIPSAAAYYCRMASLHKQKTDEANRKAANILSRVFTGEYNNLKGCSTGDEDISRPPMTLDMHSMSVLEALRVVNAFLDAHAEWLRNNRSRTKMELTRKSNQGKMVTLFLITGRGVNSQGGIPRIKPAVERQLEKRGVWYEELNPGLLRVMVSASLPSAKKM